MNLRRLLCLILAALLLTGAASWAEPELFPEARTPEAAEAGESAADASEEIGASAVEACVEALDDVELGDMAEAAETPAIEDGAAEPAPEAESLEGAEPAASGESPEGSEGPDAESSEAAVEAEAPSGIEGAGEAAEVTADISPAAGQPGESAGDETSAETPTVAEAAPVPVAGITAPSLSITVGRGECMPLCVTPLPAGAVCALAYVSDKPNVAAVTADGFVVGGKKGKATITVASDGGHILKIAVKVVGAPKRIHMNRHCLNLASGEVAMLTYTLYGGRSAVAFESSNPGVAAVEPTTGAVVGVSPGTAIVTARTANGKAATCQVNVDTVAVVTPPGLLEITFMNIGHNDGILLSCNGEYAFIDSGEHPQGITARRYLRSRGVYHLKYYIGTHGHEDHLGGAPVLLEALDVDTVIVPHKRCIRWIKRWSHGAAERAATKAANYHIMKPGEAITLGDAVLTCLGPIHVIKAGTEEGGPENRNSLVLRVTHGANSFLLAGDALGGELVDIARHYPDLMHAKVLKNPHHNNSTPYAVRKVNPEIVVFCTGAEDPVPAYYLSWIRKRGAKVYITAPNKHGHVSMFSDGIALNVITQH